MMECGSLSEITNDVEKYSIEISRVKIRDRISVISAISVGPLIMDALDTLIYA